jgi:transposase
MVRLHGLGSGGKRLSQEFGCARNTVRRYLRAGRPVAYRQPDRRRALDGLEDWLRETAFVASGDLTFGEERQRLPQSHLRPRRFIQERVQLWSRIAVSFNRSSIASSAA